MGFMPAKELVLNQLIRIPQVKARAQQQHFTGYQQDDRADALFQRHVSRAGAPLDTLRVLELGPGRGTAMMRAATSAGVAGYAAYDIEPYLKPSDLPSPDIDYRTSSDGRLPWEDGSFDLVWSHSVMEHVRQPAQLLAEVHRVLRPGGRQLAEIDLHDHYQSSTDPDLTFNMLKYPSWLWNLMASNRSAWTNRLRYTDWVALVEAAGFTILSAERHEVGSDLAHMRQKPYLKDRSDEDVMTMYIHFVLER